MRALPHDEFVRARRKATMMAAMRGGVSPWIRYGQAKERN